MSFERVQALADAVLTEGYVLYPYRASSAKNRYRWTFGVLAPRAWSEAGGSDPFWLESQCLLEVDGPCVVRARLRFFQVERRETESTPDGVHFAPVTSLEVSGRTVMPWEEGRCCEVDFSHPVGAPERTLPFAIAGERREEAVRDASGRPVGRIVWERLPLHGTISVRSEPVTAARPLVRLIVRVSNLTPWPRSDAPRAEVMRGACAGVHLLFSASSGGFLSLIDPPAWAQDAARACHNERTYPVLAGPPGTREWVLSAPIILYDHAQIAPESPGDLFDATEIDEILTLRTSTLTEEEKREARATDPRAAAVVDRVEGLSTERLERLHGAFRDLHAAEMVPRARPRLAPGSRVRILPSRRRTDAQDLLFVGCVARVEKLLQDVDGKDHVAVTLEDDPAAELHRWYGRFHYYALDEVEWLSDPHGVGAEDLP